MKIKLTTEQIEELRKELNTLKTMDTSDLNGWDWVYYRDNIDILEHVLREGVVDVYSLMR